MIHPTWAETAVLIILAGVSVYLFSRRFWPVIATILRSKRDPGWHYGSTAHRVRTFVWEVMCQGKVIRERPLPGIAHAFVFWGFCAFALVTLDHLARGLGLQLLDRQGFGRVYFAFAGVFAVAVAASIVGLAARRFLARPRWLGEVSYESGLIALLIFVLMATYLLTFRLGEGSTAGHWNWWAHTATLLIFLPLIPHTKHLHLILSPATVFLKRPHFSDIPPLEGDEDFGIQTGKDVSRIVALQVFSCVECGRCTEHCPAKATGKVLDPKEIVLGVREYLRAYGAGGDKALVDEYVSEKALFECTSCGACEYQCPVGIQHVPIIQGLRRGLVNTDRWEDATGTKRFLDIQRYGNPLGMASTERDKFVQKAGLPIYDGTQEYCLWLGCMGAYDPRGREIVLALVSVMRHFGVSFGVLKKERCSGDPVRRLGNDLLFQELAGWNLEQIRSAKVVKMISICPHCVRTIGEDWAEAGGTVQIEHHSAFLARYADQLSVGGGTQKTVVFHDPCYLGRYASVYQEPRAVIDKTYLMVEPRRDRERSFCCGAGGGQAWLGEEEGERISESRARELAETGANVIAAACPFCNTMFRDALVQIGRSGQLTDPELLDIAQIAVIALTRNENSKSNS
jgi:Fe-S oxidoreductase